MERKKKAKKLNALPLFCLDAFCSRVAQNSEIKNRVSVNSTISAELSFEVEIEV